MVSTSAPKFGVRFLSRKERTVRRVTKLETREIQKRLEPPKPVRVRPSPKPKEPKAPKPKPVPATLVKQPKPPKPPSICPTRCHFRSRAPTVDPAIATAKATAAANALAGPRTLQTQDLSKLSRLNCSREFSLFHQYIKGQLNRSYENQLAFLQTKLQHLKNEFVNKQAEHLNFEQIRDYYNEAAQAHIRREIQPDEFLTLADKYKQDIRQAIDKWLRKKELKPQRQVTEYSQRRQARIRDRIKETLEEVKKQQQGDEDPGDSNLPESDCSARIARTTTELPVRPAEITTIDNDDDDVMVID